MPVNSTAARRGRGAMDRSPWWGRHGDGVRALPRPPVGNDAPVVASRAGSALEPIVQRRGRTRMHHPPALLALCLAVASACDVADDAVDVAVAERSVNALSANTNLALVAERFAGEPAMAAMSVDAARTRAVELVAQRIGALALLSCDPQVTADPLAGTVHAMVSDCRIGPVRLDGEVDGSVAIETAACGTGECPSTVVWTLDDFDLQIGANLLANRRPHFVGPVTFRDPIDAALPMSWATGEGFVIDIPFGLFDTVSHASWTFDADDCVTMQVESRLDRQLEVGGDETSQRDRERRIGTMVVSVSELRRCPAKCPTAGHVQLAFGRGHVLAWEYDDDRTVDVTAPGGRHFETELACDE